MVTGPSFPSGSRLRRDSAALCSPWPVLARWRMLTATACAGGCHERARGDDQRGPGRARGPGHRVPGPGLPERLRAHPAVQRSGGRIHDPAPGPADPLTRAVRQDRAEVPPRSGRLRRDQPHPLGQVHQGSPQGRRHAALPGPPGCHRPVRGRGDRRGPGVPAGVDRLSAGDQDRRAAVHLRQG